MLFRPYTPSIRLDNWHPNVPDDCIDTNPTDDQSKKGYEKTLRTLN